MTDHADHLSVDVDTTHGPIRGQWLDDVAHFAGIPFAAPPVGDLRFRPPAPVDPWSDVLDAREARAVAPQNPSVMDALFEASAAQWDEDCLTLNVWTTQPSVDGGALLPTMVWIHGGGFEMGSGSSPLYDGTHLARHGVVPVTINYRLGSLGFLELGGVDPEFAGSANNGLLDQVAALTWVRDNIGRFGGDPDNVTVFGQSAGAMSASLLMAMPAAAGLFHRCIAQSGATNCARTPERAFDDTAAFMTAGGFDGIADLANAPAADLLAAQTALSAARLADPEGLARSTGDPMAFLPFRPVADGVVVPTDPLHAIANGSASGIALVAGSTAEEWKLFTLFLPKADSDEALRASLAAIFDDVEAAYVALRSDHPGSSFEDLQCAAVTDAVFTGPVDALLEAQAPHAPTFRYLWSWQSPAMGGAVGAAHAVELPFVFGLVEDHRLHVFVGADAPVDLSLAVTRAWTAFATGGDPGTSACPWPPYDPPTRPVVDFDTEIRVVADPRAKMRSFLRERAD